MIYHVHDINYTLDILSVFMTLYPQKKCTDQKPSRKNPFNHGSNINHHKKKTKQNKITFQRKSRSWRALCIFAVGIPHEHVCFPLNFSLTKFSHILSRTIQYGYKMCVYFSKCGNPPEEMCVLIYVFGTKYVWRPRTCGFINVSLCNN